MTEFALFFKRCDQLCSLSNSFLFKNFISLEILLLLLYNFIKYDWAGEDIRAINNRGIDNIRDGRGFKSIEDDRNIECNREIDLDKNSNKGKSKGKKSILGEILLAWFI